MRYHAVTAVQIRLPLKYKHMREYSLHTNSHTFSALHCTCDVCGLCSGRKMGTRVLGDGVDGEHLQHNPEAYHLRCHHETNKRWTHVCSGAGCQIHRVGRDHKGHIVQPPEMQKSSAQAGAWTHDPEFKNLMLCQLRYPMYNGILSTAHG